MQSLERVLVLLCLSLGGCAHTLSVTVDARPIGKQDEQSVGVGQTLRSGDQLSLKVESDQPGYVYVLRVPQSGTRQVLQGEQPISPGTTLHLPSGGGYFQLDDEVGEENLFILASATRLPEADLQTIDLGLKKGAGKEYSVRDEPPPIIGDKERGQRVKIALRKKGITILRFMFQHR